MTVHEDSSILLSAGALEGQRGQATPGNGNRNGGEVRTTGSVLREPASRMSHSTGNETTGEKGLPVWLGNQILYVTYPFFE